jgi:arylsulfatase A-like enzyme
MHKPIWLRCWALSLSAVTLAFALAAVGLTDAQAQALKPNILVIWGDDIGIWNISYNNRGMMGYSTPNIDQIAREGVAFTDYYGQQSCTAGRAVFMGRTVPVRTGMTKVGLPGA